jgi:TRAP-type mannitol/chloroaromatic compound transport system substrate-binding protein
VSSWSICGGLDLCNEVFAKHEIYGIPSGKTGAQIGGRFRKEVKTVEDLQGIKFGIGGLGGQVMQKLGAVPQQLPNTVPSIAIKSPPVL